MYNTIDTHTGSAALFDSTKYNFPSEWLEMKAEELQRAADGNDIKSFYSRLKEVSGPQTKQHVHLKSSNVVETFTDSKSVMARWS